MKKSIVFLYPLLLLLTFACNKEEQTGAQLEAFLGDYLIQSTHISGIHTRYDSIGNIIFMGYDTTLVADENLSITRQEQSDTLLIDGLIQSFFAGQRKINQADV